MRPEKENGPPEIIFKESNFWRVTEKYRFRPWTSRSHSSSNITSISVTNSSKWQQYHLLLSSETARLSVSNFASCVCNAHYLSENSVIHGRFNQISLCRHRRGGQSRFLARSGTAVVLTKFQGLQLRIRRALKSAKSIKVCAYCLISAHTFHLYAQKCDVLVVWAKIFHL